MDGDAERVAAYCRQHLGAELNKPLDSEYFYQSLPFCVIDAVYSIAVRYCKTVFESLSDEPIMNVVGRYCEHFTLRPYRDRSIIPPQDAQLPVSCLVKQMNQIGCPQFTEKIFDNRQRTSARSGILKSEAVLQFAAVLYQHGVNCFQDVPTILDDEHFVESIKRIRGQSSGVSLTYFLMLSGSDNFVKDDRRVRAFLKRCLDRSIRDGEAQELLSHACALLKSEYPNLNERLLDNRVWNYERALRPERTRNNRCPISSAATT